MAEFFYQIREADGGLPYVLLGEGGGGSEGRLEISSRKTVIGARLTFILINFLIPVFEFQFFAESSTRRPKNMEGIKNAKSNSENAVAKHGYR